MGLEFYLFLPQMRMEMPAIVERARAAEEAGFVGVTGMDHMAPPLAFPSPMYEAMVTSTWVAAHTSRLRIGSLVMCDAFRHPAMLAKEAVSLDHASGGRFDFGFGWGSVPDEFTTFGVGTTDPAVRVSRMKESVEIIRALWSGEPVDYDGEFFQLKGAQQAPLPLGHIPIVIGGAGRKTLELVSAHADWWNLHIGQLDKVDEMRSRAGNARLSLQIQVALVPSEDRRNEIAEVTRRRFGSRPLVGSAPELIEHFASLAERGVERVYVWFCDFAPPDTLAAFGDDVIGSLS
jgi:alkanesulfonate monooxygenase SsuD/methylene tetrahydromethanopterin reductase-like flavin-dependent oxidoreductase (luciferase family)